MATASARTTKRRPVGGTLTAESLSAQPPKRTAQHPKRMHEGRYFTNFVWQERSIEDALPEKQGCLLLVSYRPLAHLRGSAH